MADMEMTAIRKIGWIYWQNQKEVQESKQRFLKIQINLTKCSIIERKVDFMLKLYLDNCCYSRPFDDLRQEKNNLEAQAIKVIIDKYCKDEFQIYTSDALVLEMNNIKDQIKRAKVLEVYNKLNLTNIKFSEKIKQRAIELRQYNIKDMDSLHLAFAESKNVDYFITTDRLLINASKRANLKIKVMNPIEFVMEVI